MWMYIIFIIHFNNRLFDRDTLFVYQYKINFLFVLNSYSEGNNTLLSEFRSQTKKRFRDNFIDYILSPNFKFCFYRKDDFKNLMQTHEFVKRNFYLLNGRAYSISDTIVIAAINESDETGKSDLKDLGFNEIKKEELFSKELKNVAE